MRPSIVKDPHAIKQIQAMRKRGESMSHIARRLGISLPTVSKIVKAAHITPQKSRPTWLERRKARRQELRQRIDAAPRKALPWTPSEEAWLIENAGATIDVGDAFADAVLTWWQCMQRHADRDVLRQHIAFTEHAGQRGLEL